MMFFAWHQNGLEVVAQFWNAANAFPTGGLSHVTVLVTNTLGSYQQKTEVPELG